ncbi:MAG: hypothetical protein HY738_08660, partial [Bacteroidia bacterium]|nr:hypothetical protein [Bacteroidia bacterium]
MKFSNFIVLLNILLSFLFFSCKQDKPSETTGGEEAGPLVGSLIDSLGTNEAVIYSVPSPVQATTLLKLLDIDYSDELINDTKIHPPTYTTSYQRALNLGV